MINALVDESFSGACWNQQQSVFSEPDTHRRASALEGQINIPYALAWYMAAYGVIPENIENFFTPRLRDSMPDPHVMQDAEQAINLICNVIKTKKPIGLFGDYDVDGACSAALFRTILAAFGISVYCHIPDRFEEGYGPNITALQKLQAQGAELILTVDCGISAHAPLAEAKEMGMKIIVIDHHKAGPELPEAEAVVNPNRLDDDSGLGHLCAAGVSFLILAGILRRCRMTDIVPLSGQMPDLLSVLDMVALATICDIVPLKGLNRTFVKQGLKILAQRKNKGLRALMDVARLDQPPSVHTLGFLLGPRINAAGRLGQSDLGLQLLSSVDEAIVAALASQLDDLNMQRRLTEQEVQIQAEDMAAEKLVQNPELPVLVLSHQDWHEGVIGIVAGRIKDRFNRPAIVIAFGADGVGKGSGRSITGFSLGDQIMAARQQGLLLSGGGHDMAAGLSLDSTQIQAFEDFLIERAQKVFSGPPKKSFTFAQSLSVASLTTDFLQWLDKIGPFGSGFAEPRFIITHCRLVKPFWMGAEKQHLSVQLDDGTAAPLRAVCFNIAGTALGQYLKDTPDPGLVRILGKLRADHFRGGDAVQFIIDDIAPA